MEAIIRQYDAAGRNETTYVAIKEACGALVSMSRAELIQLAALVCVYVGGMSKGRMADAIHDRMIGRLYMHERTCYGSEGR